MSERFGNCRVVRELGQGPLTVVYEARQEPLDRPVAIKALRPSISPSSSLSQRLEREAHVLSTLRHEGIVELFDFVRTDAAMWLVLEHVEGPTLSALLERSPRLPLPAALSIAEQIARALSHAHERFVVHRDLRPEGVLLTHDGAVKLSGFGVAHDERQPSSPEPIEGAAAFAAPHYMSPEQVLGQDVDVRSDVFSLGVLLYQMLSGSRPFDAPDIRALTQRIRHDAPRPLSQVPAKLARLVSRCLEKQPEHRFSTAQALVDELTAAASELGLPLERQEVAAALSKAGLGDARAKGLSRDVKGSPRREGIGRAAVGQLVVLALMVGGAGAIQSSFEGADVGLTEGVDTLELVPEKAASLRVLARPWATVWVDGIKVDVTPFARAIPLRAGEHEVVLRHPAAPDERRVIKLAEGETVLVDVEMKVPEPPPTPSATAAPAASPGSSSSPSP